MADRSSTNAVPSARTPTQRLARLSSERPHRRALAYLIATIGTIGLTAALLPLRDLITPLSVGFGFLVVVVLSAAVGGLGPGFFASIVDFLTFNFLFIPPYNTFTIARPEHVVMLFVFLGLSILISALLARATERADAAEAREDELRTLQLLSAQLVVASPGPGTYGSVLRHLAAVFGFAAGALFVQDADTRKLHEQATIGVSPGEIRLRPDPALGPEPVERLPLSVRGRNLGLFVLRGPRSALSPSESRVLRAFCDQFALVLERDRLLQRATEAEVYRQTDRVRRSMLAAVSHDLRSPLAAIKASVTDLLEGDRSSNPTDVHEALASIDRETDRLTSLIANLLDMSRIEGGMLRPRLQNVDLADILATCAERLRRQWADLAFDIHVRDDASVVRADPVFLDRVATNLLENAGKAVAEADQGGVVVEGRASDLRVVVRVIDHGRGVPADAREQLFYPFYQVTERDPGLGTGLGLAIAKGFLVLMDGEIWIEDTPGGGATLAFSLPVGDAP
ncbi:MAG: sensor histidine kinase [Actinomycetota bacterium]